MKQSSLVKHPSVLLCFIVIFVIALYWLFRPQAEIGTSVKKSLSTSDKSQKLQQVQSMPKEQADFQNPNEQDFDFAGLNLSLKAVIVANPISLSTAMIEKDDKITSYRLNQQIANTQVVVAAIYHNYVVLVHDQQEYSLRLSGEVDKTSQAKRNQTSEPAPQRSAKDSQLAAEIGNRPKELAHIVELTPASDGFFVTPGLNPTLFRSAKFKEGDVLQSINGLDLSDPEQLAQAKTQIATAETLEFKVLRAGQIVTLYLDIPAPDLSISV